MYIVYDIRRLLVVTSPREMIPRTLVRFSPYFPEEDLCPMHEFSWWSLGRNAVGQANDVESCGGRLVDYGPRGKSKVPVTSGGDWRNCNRSRGWPLQHLPSSHYLNAVLSFLANDNGASRLIGDVLNESE